MAGQQRSAHSGPITGVCFGYEWHLSLPWCVSSGQCHVHLRNALINPIDCKHRFFTLSADEKAVSVAEVNRTGTWHSHTLNCQIRVLVVAYLSLKPLWPDVLFCRGFIQMCGIWSKNRWLVNGCNLTGVGYWALGRLPHHRFGVESDDIERSASPTNPATIESGLIIHLSFSRFRIPFSRNLSPLMSRAASRLLRTVNQFRVQTPRATSISPFGNSSQLYHMDHLFEDATPPEVRNAKVGRQLPFHLACLVSIS